MFANIFNYKNFRSSIPFIATLIGICSIAYGIFGTFETSEWKEFWLAFGKTFTTGGVFAVLLKSFQFMGVFKEELTKIIFEPKFLSNRVDIVDFWEKVTLEMYKNKFKNLSTKLHKDIKDIYLPTKQTTYYDECEHIFEISLNEERPGFANVKTTTNMNIIPTFKEDKCFYTFGNTMSYLENPEKEITFNCIIKVNGKEISISELKCDVINNKKNKTIEHNYKCDLKGADKYSIERIFKKEYNVAIDNIMSFKATRIINTLKVEIHYPKDKFSIDLHKCGCLENFVNKQTTNSYDRYICNGILYPEQGYLLNVKFK